MNFKENPTLLIIAVVAIVNALGYGIIIPVLYSYSQRFGLSDFGNGLLFAVFSIFQFLATPLIGRLSDKYGRRPLLVLSIAGTALSFVLMAVAPNAAVLFIARALDGLTAGNLPVAQAVISDTTKPADRAKGFGLIGASFGFGFVFGPVISALTVGYSPTLPFWIAAGIAMIGTLITATKLPETNKHRGQVKEGKLFDFPKLWHTLFDPNVGVTFVITLLYTLAFSLFIYAFQPYAVKVLLLSAPQISGIFTTIGIVGLVTQMWLVNRVSERWGIKRAFAWALAALAISFLLSFKAFNFYSFLGVMVILAVANGIVQPLINTILSREADDKSQGSIMGLNTAYASIGQIVGPILGGAAAVRSVSDPFLAAAAVVTMCFGLSFRVLRPGVHKESAF